MNVGGECDDYHANQHVNCECEKVDSLTEINILIKPILINVD